MGYELSKQTTDWYQKLLEEGRVSQEWITQQIEDHEYECYLRDYEEHKKEEKKLAKKRAKR